MNQKLIGLIIILLSAVLLPSLYLLLKRKDIYFPRNFPAIDLLKSNRTKSIERGLGRGVVLGHRLWSQPYPGLGLAALQALPIYDEMGVRFDGRQQITTSAGSLLLFTRQILSEQYIGGFSEDLHQKSESMILGVTPWSYTAGLLPELSAAPQGSLSLLGYFGPEAALWGGELDEYSGHIFAAGGTLAGQAALFLSVRDLILGESIYALPGLFHPTPLNKASLLTGDILRALLILALLVGVGLKLAGVL